jgi:Mn2+/Fe2+ NRAMP family transporter
MRGLIYHVGKAAIMRGGTMRKLIFIIYLVIGVVVAAVRGYFALKGLQDVVSLVLAVVLWPLVLFGINVKLGGGGGGGRGRGLLLPIATLGGYWSCLGDGAPQRESETSARPSAHDPTGSLPRRYLP